MSLNTFKIVWSNKCIQFSIKFFIIIYPFHAMKTTSIFSEIGHLDSNEHVHAMVPSHEHFQATHHSQHQPIDTLFLVNILKEKLALNLKFNGMIENFKPKLTELMYLMNVQDQAQCSHWLSPTMHGTIESPAEFDLSEAVFHRVCGIDVKYIHRQ